MSAVVVGGQQRSKIHTKQTEHRHHDRRGETINPNSGWCRRAGNQHHDTPLLHGPDGTAGESGQRVPEQPEGRVLPQPVSNGGERVTLRQAGNQKTSQRIFCAHGRLRSRASSIRST